MNEPYDLVVGQTYLDNDSRERAGEWGPQRRLTIEVLTDSHAICRIDAPGRQTHGRTTRIRRDRFKPTSTGYLLVEADA